MVGAREAFSAGVNTRVRIAGELALISAAATVFLGMYLATIGLGEAVARGDFGRPTPQMVRRADEFGVLWRHGQVWWPIYVPGFFISAFAVAPSARHTAKGALSITGAGLLAGWPVAALLAPYCARLVGAYFARSNGLSVPASVWVVPPTMGYPAAITFLAWTTLVLGFGFVVRARRWRIFLTALALYTLVAGIRGSFAFGELARTWLAQCRSGDAVAITSLLAAFAATGFLALYFASPATIGLPTDKTRRNGASVV